MSLSLLLAVSVYAYELTAHVGNKLLLLAADLNCRKLGCSDVVTEQFLDALCVPGTGNRCCDLNVALSVGCKTCDDLAIVGLDNECGVIYVLSKSLHNAKALCVVIVNVNCSLYHFVIVGNVVAKLRNCEEEAGEVPTVIVELEVHLLACCVSCIKEIVESIDVVLADNGLIVVEEEGVIFGAGVCEELILTVNGDCSCINRACGVDFLNVLFNITAYTSERAACVELIDLVTCEGEYVGAGGYIVENLIGCVALALYTEEELVFLVGVSSSVCSAHSLEHFLVFLRSPNGEGDLFFLCGIIIAGVVIFAAATSYESEAECEYNESCDKKL